MQGHFLSVSLFCRLAIHWSALNRVSALHLSQVVHVNFVQTQPKVTHTSKVDLASQGSLSIQVLLGDWQSLTGVHLQSAPL